MPSICIPPIVLQHQGICLLARMGWNADIEERGLVIMEYVVKVSKRRAFWSINEDILKITILKTNTPYPSRKIRRIRACTHLRPQRKEDQYAVSRRSQYTVFKIYRLSFSDVMVPLIEPLSAENLVGEASTSGVPAVVAATTALSTTFVQASFVLPIPALDHEVVDMEPQVEASSSPKIIFEQETLETSPEHPAA
ncbi:hypothetical protein Tco_1201795 [Tanacetum coccineum]